MEREKRWEIFIELVLVISTITFAMLAVKRGSLIGIFTIITLIGTLTQLVRFFKEFENIDVECITYVIPKISILTSLIALLAIQILLKEFVLIPIVLDIIALRNYS